MQRYAFTILLAAIGTVLALGTIAIMKADPSDIPAVLDSVSRLVRAFGAAL